MDAAKFRLQIATMLVEREIRTYYSNNFFLGAKRNYIANSGRSTFLLHTTQFNMATTSCLSLAK